MFLNFIKSKNNQRFKQIVLARRGLEEKLDFALSGAEVVAIYDVKNNVLEIGRSILYDVGSSYVRKLLRKHHKRGVVDYGHINILKYRGRSRLRI